MFEDIYGASCVENQVLSILKSEGNNIAALYHNSAISLKQVFDCMVTEQQNPYYFNAVPRIQEELSQMGIVDSKFKQSEACTDICGEISKCQDGEYYLIRVTPTFTKVCLNARAMRDDHFVRVEAIDEDFVIYNDIPEKVVKISADMLKKVFANQYIIVTPKAPIDDLLMDRLWKNRKFKAEEYTPYFFTQHNLEGIKDAQTRIRNMIQIYKMMCYRMAEYYGLYVDTKFIRDKLPQIEHYYALSQYYVLKGDATAKQLLKLLTDVNSLEDEIMSKLNQLL